MSKILFITRPRHDDTTHYLFHWSKKIIDFAGSKSIDWVDFNDKRANRKAVEKFINNKQPRLIVFNGHGSDDSIAGHKDEIIIKAGENEEILKEKIVYAISCNSSKVLGVNCIDAGTTAYIGYDDDFTFVFDKNKFSNPLTDEFAEAFFESSNQIAISLLKGKTVEEAYTKSQSTFEEYIDRFQRSDAPPEAENILWWLVWDKFHQKVLGDNNSSF